MKIVYYSLLLLFLSQGILSSQEAADHEIIVGIKDSPPFIIADSDNNFSGISIDLWNKIADSLNLRYKFKLYDLSGLILALEKNQIDLCINPLTVTSRRVEKIDFTQPFYITSLAIAANKESNTSGILFLTQFFSLDFLTVILFLFLIILIFGVIVWLFERRKNPDQFENGVAGIWSGIWWSAVTMTTVGYGDKSPRSLGGRIIALIWMFTAIITISSFTASITSSLTINKLKNKIKGPEDLKYFKVGSIKSSTSDTYLNSKKIDHENFKDVKNGLEAIEKEEIDAFVYDEPIIKYLLNQSNLKDNITVLPYKFNTQYYSFSLPKNSMLLDKINPLLLQEINSSDWPEILSRYNLYENY